MPMLLRLTQLAEAAVNYLSTSFGFMDLPLNLPKISDSIYALFRLQDC